MFTVITYSTWKLNILRHICQLLGNGSVNTFQQHKRSTTEGHPLLGNALVDVRSGQQ
jgi:hypothetical protein